MIVNPQNQVHQLRYRILHNYSARLFTPSFFGNASKALRDVFCPFEHLSYFERDYVISKSMKMVELRMNRTGFVCPEGDGHHAHLSVHQLLTRVRRQLLHNPLIQINI